MRDKAKVVQNAERTLVREHFLTTFNAVSRQTVFQAALPLVNALLRLDVFHFVSQRVGMNRAVVEFHFASVTQP